MPRINCLLYLCFGCIISRLSKSEPHKEITNEQGLNPFKTANVTAQVGDIAFLHCGFLVGEEKAISWIRRKDFHILTSGNLSYTKDGRFHLIQEKETGLWLLQIRNVKESDSGIYECQISTGAGISSAFTRLKIVAPRALILGARIYFMDINSHVKLTCIIKESMHPPLNVFWYHNGSIITYGPKGSNVYIDTERSEKTKSFLNILKANFSHSGNYTCSAPHTQSDTVSIFISNGDKIAAIQRRKSSGCQSLERKLWDRNSRVALIYIAIILLLRN